MFLFVRQPKIKEINVNNQIKIGKVFLAEGCKQNWTKENVTL